MFNDENLQKSYLLTAGLAESAVNVVVPSIVHLMDSGVAKRHDLHIVVLDPAVLYMDTYDFEDAVLYERSLGDETQWEHDYRSIARGKAMKTWRNQVSSRQMRDNEPWLLQAGDVKYVGSVAFGSTGSLVVACSGVQDYFDEGFSLMIAAMIQALCRHALTNLSESDSIYYE